MARTFTTLFSYSGNIYTAVISHVNGTINIYVPDESLHDILPNGRANFNPQEGFTIDTPRLSSAQKLVLHILSSIEKQNETEPLKHQEVRS